MTAARSRPTAALLLAALLLAALLPAATRAASPDPRVVLVVGPVGSLTESYRRLARAGAEEARRWTDDVIEVYSPNATWPRVRAALQGASIVVYLGHGNGFPSPYGSTLRPSVQDGFGLNPVAGRGDAAHQYFGESFVAGQVDLAPGAAVLLFHLCYASGLSEPGVPEGTEATARQRIDNFAAGFLAAGASAVVADAYASPAPYLRALLGRRSPVRAAWDGSTTGNGNVLSFASSRTPGAVAFMDPEEPSSGFTRSLVLAAGATGTIPAGPGVGGSGGPGSWEYILPPEPSSAPDAFDLGARPGVPSIKGMALAGSSVVLELPVEVPQGVSLGSAYRLGTRWIPIDDPGAPVETPPGEDPALVARESAATLVDVLPATVTGSDLAATVTLPWAVGRYRLEVTLHDGDGVALPHAVQATIPGVVVHVGGPGAAWLGAPPSLAVTAATLASIQVQVTNGEARPWGSCPAPQRRIGRDIATCPTVRLVGRWLPVIGGATATPLSRRVEMVAASATTVWLAGRIPAVPGTYLLVLGLERTADDGSTSILGRPVTVTVEVSAAPLVPTPAGG